MKDEDEKTRLERETACFMACEPSAGATAAFATYDALSYDDDIASDDEPDKLDWSKFPSYGPFSEEEAIARIDEFEAELAAGKVEWIRIDDIHAELKKLHSWL